MTAKVRLGLIADTDLPEQSTHVRVLPQHLDSSSTPLVSDSAGIEPSGLVKNPSLTVAVAEPGLLAEVLTNSDADSDAPKNVKL